MASLDTQPRTHTFQFGNAPHHWLDDKELGQLFEAVAAFERSEADVLVIRGSGNTFSKGFDLARMRQIADPAELRRCLDLANQVVHRLADCAKITVAAINGHCFGGGLEVAMACRFRLCSSKARLGLPEIWTGILPGMGGIYRLVELVGEAKALEMIALGDLLTADQACAAGLINRVCAAEQFDAEIGAFSCGLQSADPVLLREALRLVRAASCNSVEEHVRDTSATFVRLAPWLGRATPAVD